MLTKVIQKDGCSKASLNVYNEVVHNLQQLDLESIYNIGVANLHITI